MFSSRNLTLLYIGCDDQIQNMLSKLTDDIQLNVLATNTTAKAYKLYKTQKIDFIVLDLPLANENGLDFIRHLRQSEVITPVIITAENPSKEVLLEAINLDITRYLPKPFEPQELMVAIQTAIKKLFNSNSSTIITLHDGFSYDPINKSVIDPDGADIQLSKKEYLLLELLLKNKRKIIPYETIETSIWQDTAMSIDALRTLVRAIRKKTYPNIISNNNSIGYKIDL